MARLPAPTPPVVPPPTPPTPAKLPTPLAGRDDADTPNPWDVSGEAALAHHNCAGPDSRHLGCVRFSQKDAIDIVQRNILQDRLPVLRAWIPTGPLTHIEVLATKWERSRYEVCVIINCRDDRLWRFEVDHCSGDIVDIYYIKTLTRDQITASVQQYLDSRSDPQDRDHFLTPKGSTKISPPSWDDHLDRWRVNVQLPRYSGGLFMQIDTSGKIWEVLHVIS